MELILNANALNDLLQKNFLQVFWLFFINGGWLPLTAFFLKAAYDIRLYRKRLKWYKTIDFVLLAVDIPRDNEQQPKAVEQMFATIAGAHTPLTWGERILEGRFQLAFAFEIVSIDGYLQFIIRTPVVFRNVVESAIYAQYPSAEITEVEDYAKDFPTHFPDPKYNVWGSEIILAKKDVYPIRTYPEFEDKISGELKDPMASVMETMNSLGPGEQFWLQFMIIPSGYEWVKRSQKEALKLAGKGQKDAKPGILSNLLAATGTLFRDVIFSSVFTTEGGTTTRQRDALPSLMLHLTPGERIVVEAIERKASKIGFGCKIRMLYVAEKQVYRNQSVISAVFGSLKQFNYNDLNGLKPDNKTKTTAYYGFAQRKKNYRKHKIMRNYIRRDSWAGRIPFILNIEELATLYHFPILTVRAPLLARLETKKREAPAYLPTAGSETEAVKADFTQQLESLKIHNDYYERRYAVNKEQVKKEPTKPAGLKDSNLPTNLPIA